VAWAAFNQKWSDVKKICGKASEVIAEHKLNQSKIFEVISLFENTPHWQGDIELMF